MGRAVGLDIGSRTIKVVELSGTTKSFRVQRVAIRQIPPPEAHPPEGEVAQDPDEVISATIREVFDSLKLPRDDVCAAFDSGATVFREILVPFHEDDQIRKVVKFEAENHLHSHALEDVVVNWVKTGSSRDGSRLTIFASPKVELQRQILLMRGAGIDPSSVDLDATALFNAYEACGVFEEKPNAILIDVGARSTNLIVVCEAKPLVLRSFLLGTGQVEAGVSKELHVPLEEGRRRTRLTSGPAPDDLLTTAAALSPPTDEGAKSLTQIQSDVADDHRLDFVRKLHREAMRSMAALQEDSAPERILLSGGGSLLPGLPSTLSEKFGLPVERIDLRDYVDWKDAGPDPEYGQAVLPAAVGCGLRMLGKDPFGIELLKEEYAPTNRFDVVKGALATFVTLLFVVLLALAFVATERRRAATTRYRNIAKDARRLYQTAELRYLTKFKKMTEDEARSELKRITARIPRDDTEIASYRGRLRRLYENLQEEFGIGRYPKLKSALEVWTEIYKALNGLDRKLYGTHFRLIKMDVKARNAIVRIELDDQAAFDKIRKQFETSPYFRERASNNTRIVELGAQQFQRGHWQRDFEFRFKEEND